MTEQPRVILDTNTLVSRLLRPRSTPADAVRRATQGGTVLVSAPTMMELTQVLGRAKFDSYVSVEQRSEFLVLLRRIAEMVVIRQQVAICRDPKDDMFLELAVSGRADFLVTGDRDLLDLGRFEGTSILTPAAFVSHPVRS